MAAEGHGLFFYATLLTIHCITIAISFIIIWLIIVKIQLIYSNLLFNEFSVKLSQNFIHTKIYLKCDFFFVRYLHKILFTLFTFLSFNCTVLIHFNDNDFDTLSSCCG